MAHFAKREQTHKTHKIRIWPLVLIEAMNGRGLTGCVRAYFIARSLDKRGRGMVDCHALEEHITDLGVTRRTSKRWIASAVRQKFFQKRTLKSGETIYAYQTLGKIALKLQLEKVGYPVLVDGEKLVTRRGWRSLVWSGFLSTLRPSAKPVILTDKETGKPYEKKVKQLPRPISQKKKAERTGVSVRRQVYYQKQYKPQKIRNRAFRGNGDDQERDDHYKIVLDDCVLFVDAENRVWQRLPDTLIVRSNVAQRIGSGFGTKRANKIIHASDLFKTNATNDSDKVAVGEPEVFYVGRLFFEDTKDDMDKMDRKQKRILKSDKPLYELPRELFVKQTKTRGNHYWQVKPNYRKTEILVNA